MKIRWWSVLLFIILVLLLFLVTPIYLAKEGFLGIPDFINLLGILFSLPTVVLIIAISFFTRFHEAIESFLKNVGSMKFPGGFEFQRQSQPLPATENETKVLIDKTDNKKSSDVEKQNTELINSVKYWKFSYLNQFFVLQTKNVLFWFSKNAPQSKQSFEMIWAPYIPDKNQQNLILSVLLQNGMVKEKDGLIQITEEGLSFLQFTGHIPPMPSP